MIVLVSSVFILGRKFTHIYVLSSKKYYNDYFDRQSWGSDRGGDRQSGTPQNMGPFLLPILLTLTADYPKKKICGELWKNRSNFVFGHYIKTIFRILQKTT